MTHSVLIVDDDREAAESLIRALGSCGVDARFDAEGSAAGALERAALRAPAVAVVDLDLGDGRGPEGGFALIHDLRAVAPHARVIVLTGHGGTRMGVRALDAGAANFLEKPADIPHLAALVRDGIVQSDLRRSAAGAANAGDWSESHLVGESAAMRRIRDELRQVAATPQAVFLTGETGTGKGVAALAIHKLSDRRAGRFVRYQPTYGSSDLVNSDLFGHVKGSFTGASADRRGLLSEAENGTLFLDEIEDLPLETQVALLGALQERRFRRLGANTEERCSFRVICAANRDPEEALESGKLRRDFYHRIAHLVINLPPLRERRDDIPLLASFALDQLREREQLAVFEIGGGAIEKLQERDWPGNVRELHACVEAAAYRAHFAGRSRVEEGDLGAAAVKGAGGGFTEQVEEFKLRLIQEALDRCGGNQARAARELQMERSTLRRVLERGRR